MEYFQLFYPGEFPSPSFLISFCIKAGTYAHVLESLFNKVAGPIIKLLIKLQNNGGFWSKHHKLGTKNTKFQKFSDTILLIVRRRKFKLQKNYYVRQQSNKIFSSIIKSFKTFF